MESEGNEGRSSENLCLEVLCVVRKTINAFRNTED